MLKIIVHSAWLIVLLLAAAQACNTINREERDDFRSLIPAYIKDSIYLAADNPFSGDKAALGRYLFYDRRLSVNETKACASCHAPNFSFTDGYRRSIGALGDNVQHNAPPLINIVFNKYLTAADSGLHFPEQQMNNPMFHDHPVELGWKGNEQIILDRLRKDSFYRQQLSLIFPADTAALTIKNIQLCIASFVKTIISLDAPYDRFMRNRDTSLLSASQSRGMQLFFSAQLNCSSCHGGINFSMPSLKDLNGKPAFYQNTGLYKLDSVGSYPATDRGLIELTGLAADMGRFRVPTLRNLAFTAPYLHDGSVADLDSIIGIYARGGRLVAATDNKGDGAYNPHKSPLVTGFFINQQQRKDLVAFLLSLSDSSLLQQPAYSNPFTYDETGSSQTNSSKHKQ